MYVRSVCENTLRVLKNTHGVFRESHGVFSENREGSAAKVIGTREH